ncbi:hypothetical protein [Sphingobium bisphenolivorans]|uniref:hypothetical protein n=1 Tax=Sphingobium bisphenolivorans TaxID=1335760 RepID=UPI000480C5AF|nr:hypothetical protein [Sphingobium bisphenolivorans]
MTGRSEALTIENPIAGPLPFGRGAAGRVKATAPAILVGLSACLLYALTIQTREAHVDEYYHLIAGRSWIENGSFAILEGSYQRARLFTIITAWSMDLFNRADLVTARIPSVILTAATVAVIFAWLRQAGARWGAMVGGALFGLAGYTLDIAHFARFYALHTAMIVCAVAALFIATRPQATSRPAWLAAAALCLAIAAHVQPVTAIALVGAGTWLLCDQRAPMMHLFAREGRIALPALLLIGLAGAAFIGLFGAQAWSQFRHVERWAAASQDEPLYYVREYFTQAPLMLLLWPVAVLTGWRRNPSLAALCVIMTGLCLLLHSFAGMKAWRYAFYSFPFLCMSYGLAFDAILARGATTPPKAWAIAAALFALLLIGNPLYRYSAKLVLPHLARVAKNPALVAAPVPDGGWNQASGALHRLAANEPLLVTGDDLRMLAHVGRFDIYISHSRLGELDSPRDFSRDFRTGRPLVDSSAGMSAIIDCNDRGLVIVSDSQWGNEMGVSPQVAQLIARRTAAVRAPRGFHLFRWQHKAPRRTCPYARHAASKTPGPRPVLASTSPRWQPGLPHQSCPSATLGIAARSAGAA